MRLVPGERSERATGDEEAFVDPRKKEAWFRNLPAEYQERFGQHFQAELERSQELDRRQKLRVWKDAGAGAAVLALFDLLAPGQGPETTLLATVVGAALGWLTGVFDATRNYAAVMGMSVFLGFQLTTRGGLSALHFFWIVLVGAAFAYLGFKREERHFH